MYKTPDKDQEIHVEQFFYHGCNILTNQIAQKEVDKSLIKPTSYLST